MKKNTILIIVIALLWIAGGLILYFGMFKDDSSGPAGVVDGLGVGPDQVAANQSGIINVLPYGKQLDLQYFSEREFSNLTGLGNPLKPVVDPDTVGDSYKTNNLGGIIYTPPVNQ